MVHQVVVNIVGPQARELLSEPLVRSFLRAHQVLGKLCGNLDVLADSVSFEDLAKGRLASRIDVGCVVVVHTRSVGGHDLLLGLVYVD